jgi:hypothetical protein
MHNKVKNPCAPHKSLSLSLNTIVPRKGCLTFWKLRTPNLDSTAVRVPDNPQKTVFLQTVRWAATGWAFPAAFLGQIGRFRQEFGQEHIAGRWA